MINKIKAFLFTFDIIGPNPKLYIFNKERYQSIFSLIISLLILILAIVFILYSIINYIKNDRPSVIYSKNNDEIEGRKILLKNTLLMFQFIDFGTLKKFNDSIVSFEGKYEAIYDNATTEKFALDVQNCKLGKNLNSKYENMFKEKLKILSFDYQQKDKNIEDFYCINSENENINLFYYPNIGSNSINLDIIFKEQNLYKPEDISIMMIYGNNLINHDDKESPISEGLSYQFIQGFNSEEESEINFVFQYLKYETDDGLFLDSLKSLNGMSFLNMNYFKNKRYNEGNFSKIGSIKIEFNKSNYDYYRRTYKKLQALLAEIMSIVSLVFEIGSQIVSFLNEKKMSIDIIRILFNVENKNKKNKFSKIHASERVKLNIEKTNNSFQLSEKKFNLDVTTENLNENYEDKKEKILKKINIFNIIKSFFCNGYKDKLITLCHDIIKKDMCIETILERLYNLNRIYNSILETEKYNLGLKNDPRFQKLNSILNNIINKELNNIKEYKT